MRIRKDNYEPSDRQLERWDRQLRRKQYRSSKKNKDLTPKEMVKKDIREVVIYPVGDDLVNIAELNPITEEVYHEIQVEIEDAERLITYTYVKETAISLVKQLTYLKMETTQENEEGIEDIVYTNGRVIV